jgi:uncharacterized protein with PQ loop repeat
LCRFSAGFSTEIRASADVETASPGDGGFMDMLGMLAWWGAALSCLVSVPQAIRVLRAKRLDGISASTYVIVLSNAAVWTAWALLTGEFAVGIPGLINGPAAILILLRLLAASRETRAHQPTSPATFQNSPAHAKVRERVGGAVA